MEIPKHLELYRRELVLKNYSENTIKNYVSQVDLFKTKIFFIFLFFREIIITFVK